MNFPVVAVGSWRVCFKSCFTVWSEQPQSRKCGCPIRNGSKSRTERTFSRTSPRHAETDAYFKFLTTAGVFWGGDVYVNSGLWRIPLLPHQISNKMKKISYDPTLVSIFSVSTRSKYLMNMVTAVFVNFFYKNNSFFPLKGKLRFIKLLWKKIRHSATTPHYSTLYFNAAPASSSRFLMRSPLYSLDLAPVRVRFHFIQRR